MSYGVGESCFSHSGKQVGVAGSAIGAAASEDAAFAAWAKDSDRRDSRERRIQMVAVAAGQSAFRDEPFTAAEIVKEAAILEQFVVDGASELDAVIEALDVEHISALSNTALLGAVEKLKALRAA